MENDTLNKVTGGYSLPGGGTSPAPSAGSPQELSLSWRDAAGPAAAVILAILFWRTFALEYMTGFRFGPGLGIPVFLAAFFAAVLLMTGRPRSRSGLLLAAAAMLLAVSCALYACSGLTVLNCFIILFLSALATFALSGQSPFGPFTLRAVPETVRLSVMALFTRIDRPFRAASQAGKNDRRTLWKGLGTAVVTLVLLGVVLALLSSADSVFGSFFDGLRRWFETFSLESVVWRTTRTILLALLFASGLCFLREPAPEAKAPNQAAPERRAAPFLAPVLALDLVYVIFCAVQIRYLFGGAEEAFQAGGWAEYARTGFFQLAAVAAIDLVLCVLCTDEARFASRGGAVLRAGNAVMLALTVFLLISAGYRMRLYIAAYGLSILRLGTIWAMLAIFVGILLAAWKLYRPSFAFYPAFFGFVLASWCLFCLSGPAGRAADYNVNAHLEGVLEKVDLAYLEELGPESVPALERLADSDAKEAGDAADVLSALRREYALYKDDAGWTQWKVCYRFLTE